MKRLFILFLLAIAVSLAHATTCKNKNAQPLIDIDILFNQVTKNLSEFTIKNTVSLTANDRWTAISGSQSTTSITTPHHASPPSSMNLSLILMKILKADNKQVALQFLILNQEATTYSVEEPRLTVKYNQKGEIKIHTNDTTIQLAVVAKNKTIR